MLKQRNIYTKTETKSKRERETDSERESARDQRKLSGYFV